MLWNVADIENEPEIEITNWSIHQTETGERHFVGSEDYSSGRVSSAIQNFDLKKLTGATRSGRVYRLIGEPGGTNNSEYVWNGWKYHNGVTEDIDVTQEVLNGK